jgi:hypothetical protein
MQVERTKELASFEIRTNDIHLSAWGFAVAVPGKWLALVRQRQEDIGSESTTGL